MGFKAYLKHGAKTMDMGTVMKLTPTPMKRVNLTPIVSQPTQNSFPLEIGNSFNVQLQTRRVHPPTPDDSSPDSSKWSNRKWYEAVTDAVDRWQMRTDGFDLVIQPDGTGDPNIYYPVKTYHGYVKTLERTYNVSFNTIVDCTMTFVVGTMYVNQNVPDDAIPMIGMFVMMSDSSCSNWFSIAYFGDDPKVYDKYNCMDSMTISGGSESPFETAVMRIPKKKLSEQIPLLYGDIVGQKNKVYVNTFGHSRMIVTQVRSDASSYTVTACCEAWLYRNWNVTGPLHGTPFFIIRQLLLYGGYGVSFAIDAFHYRYDSRNDVDGYDIPSGTNVWRALQILATCLGCKMFFANGEAWLIDYRYDKDADYVMSPNGAGAYFNESIDLYATKRCAGDVTFDEEGSYPLTNAVDISCMGDDGSEAVVSYEDEASVERFGEANRQKIYLRELNGSQALAFAKSYVSYRAEPQRSVKFTFKELYRGSTSAVWSSYFGYSSAASAFEDSTNGDMASNESVTREGEICTQKLVLSSYTRHYPKGTCEYTFGTIANIDLSSSTSELNNKIG